MPTTAYSALQTNALAPTTLTAWDAPKISHGFLGRLGGVSRGAFASLNLAYWVNDDRAAVDENWRRWHVSYPALTPVYLQQIHGNTVLIINDDHDGTRHQADGMVTTAPGVGLSIFSADCVPMLLADVERGVVGALHAGWRGTLTNIAAAGVQAMVALGARPDAIDVALGPSIGVCCFEVDAELADQFATAWPVSRRHIRPGRLGKVHLDLRPLIQEQLMSAGVDLTRVATVGPCTKCASDRYFSRRAARGMITGLQMSFIGLQP